MFECVHTYACARACVCGYARERTEHFKYTYNIIVHNQFISKFYIGTVLSQNVKSVNIVIRRQLLEKELQYNVRMIKKVHYFSLTFIKREILLYHFFD